jgi:hypothetical protein
MKENKINISAYQVRKKSLGVLFGVFMLLLFKMFTDQLGSCFSIL